jgi:hypothetical protein
MMDRSNLEKSLMVSEGFQLTENDINDKKSYFIGIYGFCKRKLEGWLDINDACNELYTKLCHR